MGSRPRNRRLWNADQVIVGCGKRIYVIVGYGKPTYICGGVGHS